MDDGGTTGDGGKAQEGRFKHLFLNCYLNFLFFEDQMQSVEGCAAAPRLKIEGWKRGWMEGGEEMGV